MCNCNNIFATCLTHSTDIWVLPSWLWAPVRVIHLQSSCRGREVSLPDDLMTGDESSFGPRCPKASEYFRCGTDFKFEVALFSQLLSDLNLRVQSESHLGINHLVNQTQCCRNSERIGS